MYQRLVFYLIVCTTLIGSTALAQNIPGTGPKIPKIAPLKGPSKSSPLLGPRGKKTLERLKKANRRTKSAEKEPKKDTLKKKPKKEAPKKASATTKQKVEEPKAEKPWQKPEGNKKDDNELSADFLKKCKPLKPGVKVTLNIYDEELANITKIIACMTGKNIIVPKSMKGKKITIYSPSVVSSEEAYRAFLTALEANGFTISRQGRFLRIVDIKDFVRKSDALKSESDFLADEDQMVTQIIDLKHVDAGEINDVLSKLASNHAQFIVYQPSNSLIVTEPTKDPH